MTDVVVEEQEFAESKAAADSRQAGQAPQAAQAPQAGYVRRRHPIKYKYGKNRSEEPADHEKDRIIDSAFDKRKL